MLETYFKREAQTITIPKPAPEPLFDIEFGFYNKKNIETFIEFLKLPKTAYYNVVLDIRSDGVYLIGLMFERAIWVYNYISLSDISVFKIKKETQYCIDADEIEKLRLFITKNAKSKYNSVSITGVGEEVICKVNNTIHRIPLWNDLEKIQYIQSILQIEKIVHTSITMDMLPILEFASGFNRITASIKDNKLLIDGDGDYIDGNLEIELPEHRPDTEPIIIDSNLAQKIPILRPAALTNFTIGLSGNTRPYVIKFKPCHPTDEYTPTEKKVIKMFENIKVGPAIQLKRKERSTTERILTLEFITIKGYHNALTFRKNLQNQSFVSYTISELQEEPETIFDFLDCLFLIIKYLFNIQK